MRGRHLVSIWKATNSGSWRHMPKKAKGGHSQPDLHFGIRLSLTSLPPISLHRLPLQTSDGTSPLWAMVPWPLLGLQGLEPSTSPPTAHHALRWCDSSWSRQFWAGSRTHSLGFTFCPQLLLPQLYQQHQPGPEQSFEHRQPLPPEACKQQVLSKHWVLPSSAGSCVSVHRLGTVQVKREASKPIITIVITPIRVWHKSDTHVKMQKVRAWHWQGSALTSAFSNTQSSFVIHTFSPLTQQVGAQGPWERWTWSPTYPDLFLGEDT